jgi:tRNA-dihydrouridine synthase B
MVTTEMISVEGLRRRMPVTWKLARQEPALSVPLAVQVFGADPEAAAEAARMLEDRGAALIDINAGCPVRKVARQGAGAALLRDPARLVRLVEAVRRGVGIPVTVKVRLGWDGGSIHIVETARRLASAGVDAIAVHARTAVQQYSGRADWAWIRRIKEAVPVPVVGNGDVTSVAAARAMLRETGCDGVMIGRGALGNPWLFTVLAHEWGSDGGLFRHPDWGDFRRTVRGHVGSFLDGAPRPAGHLRKLLSWYSRGCPDGARLRSQITEARDVGEMLDRFDRWLEAVAAGGLEVLTVKLGSCQRLHPLPGAGALFEEAERQ